MTEMHSLNTQPRLGRKLVADRDFSEKLVGNPEFLLVYDEREWFARLTLDDVLKEKEGHIRGYYFFKGRGARAAKEYRALVESASSKMALDLTDAKELAIRTYDLIRWGNFDYAKRYIERVSQVMPTTTGRTGFRATKAALRNLYKVMAIKDELWVAELLLSEEKLKRDRIRYNIDLEGETQSSMCTLTALSWIST